MGHALAAQTELPAALVKMASFLTKGECKSQGFTEFRKTMEYPTKMVGNLQFSVFGPSAAVAAKTEKETAYTIQGPACAQMQVDAASLAAASFLTKGTCASKGYTVSKGPKKFDMVEAEIFMQPAGEETKITVHTIENNQCSEMAFPEEIVVQAPFLKRGTCVSAGFTQFEQATEYEDKEMHKMIPMKIFSKPDVAI